MIELTMKVGSNRDLRAVVTTERDKLDKLKPGTEVRVKIDDGARSLSSNALSHAWYNEAAKQTNETTEYVKCYCKLHFGILILRAENEKFRALYDKSIRQVLSYEEKIQAMQILPVTSLMSRDQMNRYLTDMQREYANRGVILETPKDSAYAKYIAEQAR